MICTIQLIFFVHVEDVELEGQRGGIASLFLHVSFICRVKRNFEIEPIAITTSICIISEVEVEGSF